MNETVRGSEEFPDDSGADRAEWRLFGDDADVYEKSAYGTLTLYGGSGTLVVRARYRADADRLGEDVVREERGFWCDGDPDSADPPFDTDVTAWEAEGVVDTDTEGFLRVCEKALTVDPVSLYSENRDGL